MKKVIIAAVVVAVVIVSYQVNRSMRAGGPPPAVDQTTDGTGADAVAAGNAESRHIALSPRCQLEESRHVQISRVDGGNTYFYIDDARGLATNAAGVDTIELNVASNSPTKLEERKNFDLDITRYSIPADGDPRGPSTAFVWRNGSGGGGVLSDVRGDDAKALEHLLSGCR